MRALADLLFPYRCAKCGLRSRDGLCPECIDGLEGIGPCRCRKCGAPSGGEVDRCRECRGRKLWFDRATQAVPLEPPVRGLIHRFKYEGERGLGETLGEIIRRHIEAAELPPANAWTWVPASASRRRQRGLDHAKLLAECACANGTRPIQLLARAREVPPQMTLPLHERRTNVKDAFVAAGPCAGVVLLVDDVYTTGATASACARALKQAGADKVFAVTVARTP